MAFYSPDEAMGQRLAEVVRGLEESVAPFRSAGLSITWVRYPGSLLAEARAPGPASGSSDPAGASGTDGSRGLGASWQGGVARDPGDLVQLPYLIAAERWLQREMLAEEPELRRALEAMTRRGSHEATAYVVDRLSGTTGGPCLAPHLREAWMLQRQLVTGWLTSLGWPELEGCRAVQKTWQEGPYGRERDGFGADGENANRFSSDGLARLLEAVLAGRLISPPACLRMRELLRDPPLPASLLPHRSNLQIAPGRMWGKVGRCARGVQLALYAEPEAGCSTLLSVLAEEEIAAAPEGACAVLLADLLRTQPIRTY